MVARPIYLDTPAGRVAALHGTPAEPSGAPVLFCGPWGWDEVSSYRSRKLWADHLVERGHPTLRFDLPAVGDSGGEPGDAGLLGAWVAATAAMADWLAASAGIAVVGLGLGLGALLLRAAAGGGAPISGLVLWAAPASGRSFYREARAFSRLQTRSEAEREGDAALPEGWIDTGGFFLSAATIAELKRFEPSGRGAVERALVLDKDGVEPDASITEGLEAEGIETEVASGSGWGAMVADARLSLLPQATIARVDEWLAAGPAARSPGALDGEAAGEASALELNGIVERPLVLGLPFGDAFGVLSEPAEARSQTCALFLNAGNVRHTGPNRLWVEAARRFAASGLPAVRLDLEAIGEADGERPGYVEDVGELYVTDYVDQVEAVIRELVERGIGRRFLLCGLCAGAYWSFEAAVRDDRVTAAILLNAGALTWDDELVADREARSADRALGRMRELTWWKRPLRGEISLGWVWRHARSLVQRVLRWLRPRRRDSAGGRRERYESGLDVLAGRGTRLVLGFSGGEPLAEELVVDGLPQRLEAGDWPGVSMLALPGDDHTLRSPSAQQAALDLFDREIAAAQAPAGSGSQR